MLLQPSLRQQGKNIGVQPRTVELNLQLIPTKEEEVQRCSCFPVGTRARYPTQVENFETMKCAGPGKKWALAKLKRQLALALY